MPRSTLSGASLFCEAWRGEVPKHRGILSKGAALATGAPACFDFGQQTTLASAQHASAYVTA